MISVAKAFVHCKKNGGGSPSRIGLFVGFRLWAVGLTFVVDGFALTASKR
jgi:hypothetical protein